MEILKTTLCSIQSYNLKQYQGLLFYYNFRLKSNEFGFNQNYNKIIVRCMQIFLSNNKQLYSNITCYKSLLFTYDSNYRQIIGEIIRV